MADGKRLLRVFLAEALGTFLLVLFGDGAIAERGHFIETAGADGSFVHIALGYGLVRELCSRGHANRP